MARLPLRRVLRPVALHPWWVQNRYKVELVADLPKRQSNALEQLGLDRIKLLLRSLSKRSHMLHQLTVHPTTKELAFRKHCLELGLELFKHG